MVYPAKVQIRYSTVLVIVLLLMGSVLYEVTRTESFGRQSAARTQDISLPAAQPLTAHLIRPSERPDYIGRSSAAASAKASEGDQGELAAAGTRVALSTPTVLRSDATVRSSGWAFGTSNAERVHSADSSGYAPGSYGMSGAGAWGGVSGVARPMTVRTDRVVKEKPVKQAKEKAPPKPKRPGGSSGGATSSDPLLVAGFTTGAAAVESGAVASLEPAGAGGKSPAGAPASTPEPMSLLLVGTGLVGLYNVRRRLQ